jgi:AcrR family transcriptional regulator
VISTDRILDIVVELLETEGYDAVQLREVARRARTSLATIYKRYGTRDELILAALDCWMEENRYAGLTRPHDADESLYAGMMRVLRTIFEPWERHPAVLKAYFRARTAPGGKKLIRRGFDAVMPAMLEVVADADADFIRDADTIVSNVAYGLLGRFAAGEIEITEILPILDRTVQLVTASHEGRVRRPASQGRRRPRSADR